MYSSPHLSSSVIDSAGFFERLVLRPWFLNPLSNAVTTDDICKFFIPNIARLNRDIYSRSDSPLSCVTCISPIAVFLFRALLEKQIANLLAKFANDDIDYGGNVSNHSVASFRNVMENALHAMASGQPCNLTRS
ncbi:hypothetical protein Fot_23726 [Forsythia ovata]|uniref:Reverse transcriptase n=1 Tax=Forsythia ovata TaxID=205694 RepID=A0ABD1U4W8_9LAMI